MHLGHGHASGDHRPARWLTLGGALEMTGDDNRGLRAEIDLRRRGRWTMGIAAAAQDHSQYGDLVERTIQGAVFLARTKQLRRWEVRVQVSGGVAVVQDQSLSPFHGDYPMEGYRRSIRPVAEASFLVSRWFGDRWALTAGPLVTTNLVEWQRNDYEYNSPASLLLFAGVRRRL